MAVQPCNLVTFKACKLLRRFMSQTIRGKIRFIIGGFNEGREHVNSLRANNLWNLRGGMESNRLWRGHDEHSD